MRGTRGEVLAGTAISRRSFPRKGKPQHIVYFGDAEWHGDPVRVAYMFMFDPQAPHRRVVVQVGETLNKRQRLSNEIIAGIIIIPQFFLFLVVALLAWFGLQRGTQRSSGCASACSASGRAIFRPSTCARCRRRWRR